MSTTPQLPMTIETTRWASSVSPPASELSDSTSGYSGGCSAVLYA